MSCIRACDAQTLRLITDIRTTEDWFRIMASIFCVRVCDTQTPQFFLREEDVSRSHPIVIPTQHTAALGRWGPGASRPGSTAKWSLDHAEWGLSVGLLTWFTYLLLFFSFPLYNDCDRQQPNALFRLICLKSL